MSVRRWVSRLLVVGVTGVTMAAGAGVAYAAKDVIRDPHGDTGSRIDIHKVVVRHSADRLKVRARVDMVTHGVEFGVFIDTRRSNQGPEWKVSAYADSEWALLRVHGWHDSGTAVPGCGRARFSADDDPAVAWVRVPNSCINSDHKVRVSVFMSDPGHGIDWAPGHHTYSRWV